MPLVVGVLLATVLSYPIGLLIGSAYLLPILNAAPAYAAMFVLRWRRNRFRIKPSELVRMIDSAEPPVILDVRDAKTYERSPVRIPNSHHVTAQSLEATRPDLDIAPDRTLVAYCT